MAGPDAATVVDGRDGAAPFTDGPFLESKEYIIGFWIIEAADLDVALRLARPGRSTATGGSRSGRSWAHERCRRCSSPSASRTAAPGTAR
ncbi:YciI family protein [Kitasatospora sp. NBC_00240]|uniref:YciI family protein n=1 Tax=Kitasatospora sp. NBC_00240 TaxID=2903567 RepID=UPI00225B148B|nr:YciI family protein [Kitasatospora sp. NBC_00240]MCX5208695.1 YciI family protein [Kitasatospora sp. NBC_00240]